ncbi:MAG: ABC transporter [Bdellovibrio sp.]|nr:MAG: ABC transporter [Bdellovibrio sp.]
MVILFFRLCAMTLTETLRQPTYVVTTLLFPAMFFWFFGVPNVKDENSARFLMGSFAAFGVLGVVLFQMTVGVAQERASSWNVYLRTLPVPATIFMFTRLFSSFFLAVLSVGCVIATALATTDISMSAERWIYFLTAVFLAGIPFAALGLVLGYLTTPRSAVPVANLIYLPFSFAGGLWIPPNGLSESVRQISEKLPTRFYGEIVWSVVLGQEVKERWMWGQAIYAVAFLAAAIYLHQRDETLRFG